MTVAQAARQVDAAPASPAPRRSIPPPSPEVPAWLRAQAVNVNRHAAALRPFRSEEFRNGIATPSEGHIRAVNELMALLRSDLLAMAKQVSEAAGTATDRPVTATLQHLLKRKEGAHDRVRSVEKIWDFYFELFGQRQSQFGPWLVACDRIALDCYQHSYVGLAAPRSIPAPAPFSYMRTGFSPATYRRGIPLRRLGRQINPFPLIQLPYHRMVNPWTLGAILHEVSHNLQNDLGLAQDVPRMLGRRLLQAGLGRSVAGTWVRWHREAFADLLGCLLGGPSVVASLMDVIGRSPSFVTTYSPRAPHPTPYLRLFISTELLRRLGFTDDASRMTRLWTRLYPAPSAGNIPRALMDTFADAHRIAVDAMCFTPYPSLGNRALSQVLRFGHNEQQMIEEAARRLAVGNDPGIVPERFLIGAARFALDHRLARPGTITEHFYRDLGRR